MPAIAQGTTCTLIGNLAPAVHLYTGPMHDHYNEALRSVHTARKTFLEKITKLLVSPELVSALSADDPEMLSNLEHHKARLIGDGVADGKSVPHRGHDDGFRPFSDKGEDDGEYLAFLRQTWTGLMLQKSKLTRTKDTLQQKLDKLCENNLSEDQLYQEYEDEDQDEEVCEMIKKDCADDCLLMHDALNGRRRRMTRGKQRSAKELRPRLRLLSGSSPSRRLFVRRWEITHL